MLSGSWWAGTRSALRALSGLPILVPLVFRLTLFFLPLYVALLGFDQLSSEVGSRSVRYLVVRSRRASILLGKFAAQAVVLARAGRGGGRRAVRRRRAAGEVAEPAAYAAMAARFWVAGAALALAYLALTTLASALTSTPAGSLFANLGFLLGFWALDLVGSQGEAVQRMTGQTSLDRAAEVALALGPTPRDSSVPPAPRLTSIVGLRLLHRGLPRRGVGRSSGCAMSSEVDSRARPRVTKRYGATVALAGVSFQVRRGKLPRAGRAERRGKTTTFGLAAGFLRPSEGTVRVLGGGAARPRAATARGWACCPRTRSSRPTSTSARSSPTGRGSPARRRPEQAARIALDRVGLSSAWDASPQSLSHGVAKRVALAQSLLGEPALLLLDEPTAGLDPRVAAEVRTLLAGLRGSCTVVISSHNLSELERLCDAVTVLDHGKVVQDGSLAEITGRGRSSRLQITRGDVPLAELRALTGVAEASASVRRDVDRAAERPMPRRPRTSSPRCWRRCSPGACG